MESNIALLARFYPKVYYKRFYHSREILSRGVGKCYELLIGMLDTSDLRPERQKFLGRLHLIRKPYIVLNSRSVGTLE